jgi:hypothetical protein
LHSRVDIQTYHKSLALCRNWFIHTHGGISTRSGFEYVGNAPSNASKTRLIPFEFNDEQTYVLVFSDQKMQVIKDGGLVLEPAQSITNITAANPAVITVTAHGYLDGETVYLAGTGVATLDGKFHVISNVTADTFEVAADGTGWTSGGTASRLFELVTPYLEADLFDLGYTQSADVLTIVHPEYQQSRLTRTDHHVWTLEPFDFQSPIPAPINVTAVEGGTGQSGTSKTYRYVVTAIDSRGNESQQSATVQVTTTSYSLSATRYIEVRWSPVAGAVYYNCYKERSTNSEVFGFIGESEIEPQDPENITDVVWSGVDSRTTITTGTAHTYIIGDVVFIRDTGVIELDDKTHEVLAVPNNTTFEIAADGTGWVSGGEVLEVPNGAFRDYNLGPDMSMTPPTNKNPFNNENYPSCTTYFQQRQWYGATALEPQTMYSTRTANYDNMDTSRPTRADDGIVFRIVSRELNAIRHIIALDRLMVFTSDNVWAIEADQDGVLTPQNINPRRQGGRGSSNLAPITVGANALYVQAREARVRDLNYNFESDGFVGADLSIMAEHLFEGHTIVDWTYAEEPFSLVWAVRDDGILLSLAYLKEHQVWGWSRHDTDGLVESVASISEGLDDPVYAVIRREINGQTVRYVERLHERKFSDIVEAFHVDSGLTYRGATHTIDGASQESPVVISAISHGLSDGDVVWIRGVEGMTELNNKRYRVVVKSDDGYELYELVNNTPIDGTGYGAYTKGGTGYLTTTTISGLDHLEGETAVALADGNVLPDLLVTDGTVTLPEPASIVHIGLGYLAEIETLDIDFQSPQGTVQSRKKAIDRVALRVRDTRGLSVGASADKQYEFKERNVSDGYNRISEITGEQRVHIATDWSDGGRMVIQQKYPLPATILAIIPEVVVGG